jgi:uncharacterized protein YbaR (Trm112 family)
MNPHQLEEKYMLQNLRQHAMVNNNIAESCFSACACPIDRKLNDDEEKCVENCATKLITATTRVVFKIAESNPMMDGGGQILR